MMNIAIKALHNCRIHLRHRPRHPQALVYQDHQPVFEDILSKSFPYAKDDTECQATTTLDLELQTNCASHEPAVSTRT